MIPYMDMMNSIAGMSAMASMARIQYEASMSMVKNSMDTMEQIALQQLEMLPPPSSLGQYIDVYA